jgi:hypothetical protein
MPTFLAFAFTLLSNFPTIHPHIVVPAEWNMTFLRTSVKLLPLAQDHPSSRIVHLHELCAYLHNASATQESHQAVNSNGEEPPRKRQRLSEAPSLSSNLVESQSTLLLASIDIVSIHSTETLPTHSSFRTAIRAPGRRSRCRSLAPRACTCQTHLPRSSQNDEPCIIIIHLCRPSRCYPSAA